MQNKTAEHPAAAREWTAERMAVDSVAQTSRPSAMPAACVRCAAALRLWFFCLVMLLWAWPAPVLSAESPASEASVPPEMSSSPAPQAAPAQGRLVRVGFTTRLGLDFRMGDVVSGFDHEFLQALAQYTGWRYELVERESWTELLAMLERGEIDLLNYVEKTPEREKKLHFCSYRCGTEKGLLAVLNSNPVDFEDFDAINGMTIGMLRGVSKSAALQKHCALLGLTPRFQVFDSQAALSRALRDGTVDAAMQYAVEPGCKLIMEFGPGDFFYATSPQNKDVARELEYGMNCIQRYRPDFETYLFLKHRRAVTDAPCSFTKEEVAYLEGRPLVRVLHASSWAPLEKWDERAEKFVGITPDVYARLADLTGLRFVQEDKHAAQQVNGALRQGGGPLVGMLTSDYAWAEQHNVRITQPFMNCNVLFASLDGNMHPRSLAQVRGDYLAARVHARRPDLKVLLLDTPKDCLDAVLNGEADATLINEFTMLTLQRQHARFRHLYIRVTSRYTQPLSFAVSKDADPHLFSIMCKALAAMSEEEIGGIIARHVSTPVVEDWRSFIAAHPLEMVSGALGLCLVLTCMGILWWRYRMTQRLAAAMAGASAAKSDFLSRMSHDMRTPMNVIIGLMDLTAGVPRLPEEAKKNLERMRDAGAYLLTLISDTLDMGRIEKGKVEIARVPVQLHHLSREILPIIRRQADNRGVHVRAELPQEDRPLLLDKTHTARVLMNLLGNAVKFTPQDGTVTFAASLRGSGAEQVLCCEVRDTGIGMSEEFIPHMFEAFAQEKAGRFGELKDSGLGLSIVHELVRLMGGEISVSSRKGKGTVFVVTLPAPFAEKSAGTRQPDVAAAAESGASANGAGRDVAGGQHCTEDGCAAGHRTAPVRRAGEADGQNAAEEEADAAGQDVREDGGAGEAHAHSRMQGAAQACAGTQDGAHERSTAHSRFDAEEDSPRRAGRDGEAEGEDGEPSASAGTSSALAGLRVLLAEDHPMNALIMRKQLEKRGMLVDHAEDGSRALTCFQEQPAGYYAALLLDIRMPVLDGLATARAVRAMAADGRPDAAEIPIVAVTANAFAEERDACARAGMNGHISKPVSPALLFAELERLLFPKG